MATATHQTAAQLAPHLLSEYVTADTPSIPFTAQASFRHVSTTFDPEVDAANLPTSLAQLVAQVPALKVYTRSSPQYEALRGVFNLLIKNQPLVICRPTTVVQISAVVAYCSQNNLPLAVRAGGLDHWGLSCASDAIIIDMREMDDKVLAADKQTVKIGGGATTADLVSFLDTHGVITPCGDCKGLGMVGWAVSGGYSPLSAQFGLGVDNILGAKLVNAQGQLVEADEELLWAIRGAGVNFGVIVELTLQVHSLPTMLAGFIVYDWQHADEVLKKYQALLDHGVPNAMGAQIGFSTSEWGVGMALIFTWADKNMDEGRKWLDIVRGLGPVVADSVGETTLKNFLSLSRLEIPKSSNVYTRSFNVSKLGPATIANLVKHSNLIPAGAAYGIAARFGHGVMTTPNPATSFSNREPHVLFQITGAAAHAADMGSAEAWVDGLVKDMQESGEVMKGGYPNFMPPGPMKDVFGKNYDALMATKKQVDPGNVFSSAVAGL